MGKENVWFVIDVVEQTFEGPLSLTDLKKGLIDQKFFWSDLTLCPALSFEWKRLYEVPELTVLCPPLPEQKILRYFGNQAMKQHQYSKVSLRVPTGVEFTQAGSPPVVSSPPPHSAPNPPPKVTVKSPAPKPQRLTDYQPEAPPTRRSAVPEDRRETPRAETAPPRRNVSVSDRRVSLQREITVMKTAVRVRPDETAWHLLIDEQELGPFTQKDIENAVKKGKRPERAYVWREPMKRWIPISMLKEFAHLGLGGSGAASRGLISSDDLGQEGQLEIELQRNVRRSFRKKLVAMVSRISETGLKQWIGVVGDLSQEGFQLIQDTFRVEYRLGSQHRIEINPIKRSDLQKFVVDCEVRWIDPDTHSIGFQFIDISPLSNRMLKSYLESQDRATPGLKKY